MKWPLSRDIQCLLTVCAALAFLSARSLCAPSVQGAFVPNYSHAPSLYHLLHWVRLPVRVFFPPDAATPGERRKQTLAGFDEWKQASQGIINYQMVSAPTQADITVTFNAHASLPKQPGVSGSTTVTYSGDVLKQAHIELAVGETTPEELQSVAAHEFGHALGIDGHSDDSNDLMYPVETRILNPMDDLLPTPSLRVTERDLNTLKVCYGSLFLPAHSQK